MQAQFFCIESHDDHWKGFWRVDVEKCCLGKLRFEKNSIHVNKISCETFVFLTYENGGLMVSIKKGVNKSPSTILF